MEYREPLLFVSVSINLLAVKYAGTKVKECELFILQKKHKYFFKKFQFWTFNNNKPLI